AQHDADALLRAAGDRDAARRGTWWINEGLRLQTDGKQIAAARTAFGNAVATFVDGAPETRGHVTSLLELSSFLQSQQEHSAALDVGRRAVEVAERLPTRDDAELQTLWGNLGIIHQQLGRFTEAADAFRRSADIADRTTGADSRAALLPRANAARTLHLAGERIAAHVEYARVVPLLAALGDQDRDGVFGRAIYCERLTAEGRPLEAIPGLEAAERSLRERAAYDFQLRLVRRFLGEAYLAAGNLSAARRMLETSLADYVANDAPESAPVLAARDAMGLLLLAEGRPLEAREQFSAVVAAERTGTLVQATLAHGGLAQVALALRDPDTALSESAQALASWSRVEGFRDVRTEPRLQRIRADALAARGDRREAQRLEDAAAAASAKYDDPRAPTVQRRSFARR
ncbi:MAG: tetratricopeptide repeat protein, partial [Steroidobacteraceae bacterium]